MTDKIKVYDNGSVGSKLLQHEYKGAQVVKGGPDLVESFTKIDNKDGVKIFLPFTVQELVADNELKRREIAKLESLGFKNLIVLPYEGHDNQYIKETAIKAGLIDTKKLQDKDFAEPSGEVVEESKKPFSTYKRTV